MDQRQTVTGGLTLALNAAEGRLHLALGNDQGAYLYGLECLAESQGVEKLAPALSDALSLLRATPADIRRVACVRGPGSFTGLRLTAVTAAGLARATGAQQAGLDYLNLLACEATPALNLAPPQTHLWVLVRARRDLVYMQGFCAEGGMLAPLCEVTTMHLDAVAAGIAFCSGDTRPLLLTGSGVTANTAFLQNALAQRPDTRLLPQLHDHPRPTVLLQAAQAAVYSAADIAPCYLRPSDAEENLPSIAARMGLDPEAAVARLRTLTSLTPEQD